MAVVPRKRGWIEDRPTSLFEELGEFSTAIGNQIGFTERLMDMKRSHAALLSLFVVFAMFATACGADNAEEVVTSSGAIEDPTSQPADDAVSEPVVDNEDEQADVVDAEDPEAEDPLADALDDAGIEDDAMDTGAPDMTDDGWVRVPPRNDLTNTKTHPILDLVVIDETHIGVRFEAIAEGCSGAEAFADESDTDVSIELFVGLPPEAASMGCMMVQIPKEIVVELAAPLGDRSLNAVGAAIPDDEVTPEMSLDDYIGLSTEDAMAKAEISGRPARVVRINGESQITTDDFVARRLNLEIVDNVVVGLTTDAGEVAGDSQGL